MTELAYAYLAPSGLAQQPGRTDLHLATSGGMAPSGAVVHPFFFSGFVEHPAVVTQALLMPARVARTRFYVPPNTLAAVLRSADPVVTSTPQGLRFESFSVCCGVYARLDVDASALDTVHSAVGVTNVDVNPPLRQALAGLRPSEPLHLSVGSQALRVATPAGVVVEGKVPLPRRWLKGFAETQMLSAGMALRHDLAGPALRQFVQALPRSSGMTTVMWAARAARSLRLASQPAPGAVCLAGPERLRVLEPLLRFATATGGEMPRTTERIRIEWRSRGSDELKADGSPQWVWRDARVHGAPIAAPSATQPALIASGELAFSDGPVASELITAALGLAHPASTLPMAAAGVDILHGALGDDVEYSAAGLLRAQAVELLAAAVPDRLDAPTAARGFAACAPAVVLTRWAQSLADAASLAPRTVIALLTNLLPQLEHKARGAGTLVTVLLDESLRHACPATDGSLRAWLSGFTGSSAAARAAKALLALGTSGR
ncbi:Uncharacterised protein [Delftia tsuruhatensis]|uniref:hypothetical protein n=1 Tax=Delftia tsuruhatensis TaxID=180282 RepID=UPI001E719C3E|nr:hypothetical protein [Delftia tsuruhatensis]CAB5723439.1 Uncharacterised protein [Delftia tsuruhatensis]CAC9686407.1 Uncharacterised protein [Delftia tsuruhatensis]